MGNKKWPFSRCMIILNTKLIIFNHFVISVGKLRIKSESSLVAKTGVKTERKAELNIKLDKFEAENMKTEIVKPENVIKRAKNGHSLVMVKRIRVKGFCVECIKKTKDPKYKSNLEKIITHCPKCPGGSWICEPCFDRTHANI